MSSRITAFRERLGGSLTDAVADRWDRLPVWGRWVSYAVLLVVVLFVVPLEPIGDFMTPDSDWVTVLFYPVGCYILAAIGLNIVVGQAGLLDLGYVAFFAIGGYSMGVLGGYYGWDFWLVLPVAALITAVAGLVLGSPTLRLRGDYLAIVTLGFGEIVHITAQNTDYLGGPRGISGIPRPPDVGTIIEFGILDVRPYYYLIVIFIILGIVLHRRLENSRVGRAWMAIREDEDAAELSGVPTFKFKLWAFALGGVVGGATGVLYASQVTSITPGNYEFILSALFLCAVTLGGSGNVTGVILGAFLIAWLPERFREFAEYRTLVFGGALVLMMAIRPGGLLPDRRRRAELAEGAGGMGSLATDVADPTKAQEPVAAPPGTERGGGPSGPSETRGGDT